MSICQYLYINMNITAMSAFDCSGFENSINRVDSLDPMDFTPVLTSSMTSDVLTSQLVNIPIGSLSPIPECNDQRGDITVSDCNTTASITASFNNDDELLESPPLVVNVEQHRDTSYVPNEEEPVEDVTVNDTREEIEEDLLNLSEPFTVQPGRPSHELRLIVNGTTKGKSCVHSKDFGKVFNQNRPCTLNGRDVFTWRCKWCQKHQCYAQFHMLPVEVILRQCGYDPEADNDGVVIPLVKGEHYWVKENIPRYAAHCGNCPVEKHAYNTTLLFKELRKLALQHLHDSKHGLQLVAIARQTCFPNGFPSGFKYTDKQLARYVNDIRKDHRARPPKRDGSDLLDFEFNVHMLPEEVPHDFVKGFVESQYQGKTNRHFLCVERKAKKILRSSRQLIIDATFGIVQRPHTQLLVIHARKPCGADKFVNMPVAYAVMQGKSEAAYKAVFQKIKDLAEEIDDEEGDDEDVEPRMQVERFIVDYERAIWNALRAVWVDATVRGCWFHFTQCIYRKAHGLGLSKELLDGGKTWKMVRRLMLLPLIDHNNIEPVFRKLKQHYKTSINDPEHDGVKKLFAYYEAQWIVGGAKVFEPKDYSCYKQQIRTTNIAENWNGNIQKQGGNKKLDLFQLVTLLYRNLSKCYEDIDHYHTSHYVRRTQVEKEHKIKKAYENYAFANAQRRDNRNWELLDDLLKATEKHSNFLPSNHATIAEPLEN